MGPLITFKTSYFGLSMNLGIETEKKPDASFRKTEIQETIPVNLVYETRTFSSNRTETKLHFNSETVSCLEVSRVLTQQENDTLILPG